MKAVALIRSLIDFVQDLRNSFEELELAANRMSYSEQYRSETTRQVTRKKRADEAGTPDDHILTGSAKFRAEVFYVIIAIDAMPMENSPVNLGS